MQEDFDELNEERLAELQKAREMEVQKKLLLKQMTDAAAYERLMNVRLANPALYNQIVATLLYLYQNGQVKGKVREETIKKLLESLAARKREPEFKVMRK